MHIALSREANFSSHVGQPIFGPSPGPLWGNLSHNKTIIASGDAIADVNASTTSSHGELDCNLFTFVLYVGVFGVMCVFGLIGNTVSFVVLSWERHSHVATFLLQVMACMDNLFLISTALSTISLAVTDYLLESKAHTLMAYVTLLVWPIVHITQMWTVWITVLIAFNRYIAICWPFRAARLCTMRQARIQVLTVAIATTLYNAPRFFEHRFGYSAECNCTQLLDTALKESAGYKIAYESALYFLFVFFGPLVILAALNACLIREMCRARRRLLARQLPASLNQEDPEHNLTLVMVIIVVIFIICQTPAFINGCLELTLVYECNTGYFYFFHLSNLLVSANSSVNFVVYCVFRRQFRQRLQACCSRSRYDYNNSLQHSNADNLPLKSHSSRSTSIQIGGNNMGPHSRSASLQIGFSSRT